MQLTSTNSSIGLIYALKIIFMDKIVNNFYNKIMNSFVNHDLFLKDNKGGWKLKINRN